MLRCAQQYSHLARRSGTSRATWYPRAPARTQGAMQQILASCRQYPRIAGDKLSRCVACCVVMATAWARAAKAEGATDTKLCRAPTSHDSGSDYRQSAIDSLRGAMLDAGIPRAGTCSWHHAVGLRRLRATAVILHAI